MAAITMGCSAPMHGSAQEPLKQAVCIIARGAERDSAAELSTLASSNCKQKTDDTGPAGGEEPA